jgi:transposase
LSAHRQCRALAPKALALPLEVIPQQWKVVTCRSCEKITQPPAPFHPIARGRAGPGLLAMVLHGKFGHHLPLNRKRGSGV